MPNLILVKNDTDIIEQRWFDQFPGQPNPVKQLYWYILQEVHPTPSATQKIHGFLLTCDRDTGIAIKTYQLVDKTPEELAAEAAAAQKLRDIADGLPSWQQVSDAIDAATTIAALKVIIKKMARILYWVVKNSAT